MGPRWPAPSRQSTMTAGMVPPEAGFGRGGSNSDAPMTWTSWGMSRCSAERAPSPRGTVLRMRGRNGTSSCASRSAAIHPSPPFRPGPQRNHASPENTPREAAMARSRTIAPDASTISPMGSIPRASAFASSTATSSGWRTHTFGMRSARCLNLMPPGRAA